LMEIGDYYDARRVLTYLLARHKERFDAGIVKRAARIVTREDDTDETKYPWDMSDQVDGNYHLVLAWAKYIEQAGDLDIEETYYPTMRAFVSYYLSLEYYDAHYNLLKNPSFEHIRAFMHTFDLVTQLFAVEAIEKMIPIAVRREGQE